MNVNYGEEYIFFTSNKCVLYIDHTIVRRISKKLFSGECLILALTDKIKRGRLNVAK